MGKGVHIDSKETAWPIVAPRGVSHVPMLIHSQIWPWAMPLASFPPHCFSSRDAIYQLLVVTVEVPVSKEFVQVMAFVR